MSSWRCLANPFGLIGENSQRTARAKSMLTKSNMQMMKPMRRDETIFGVKSWNQLMMEIDRRAPATPTRVLDISDCESKSKHIQTLVHPLWKHTHPITQRTGKRGVIAAHSFRLIDISPSRCPFSISYGRRRLLDARFVVHFDGAQGVLTRIRQSAQTHTHTRGKNNNTRGDTCGECVPRLSTRNAAGIKQLVVEHFGWVAEVRRWKALAKQTQQSCWPQRTLMWVPRRAIYYLQLTGCARAPRQAALATIGRPGALYR